MKYRDFTEFPVWKRAFNLVLKVYVVTRTFPSEEKYGLISDMRRSANSILHNIAEAFGRSKNKDKNNFYTISRGSAQELISQILISNALTYISESDKDEIIKELKIIIEELNSIIKTLSQPQP